MADVIAPDQFGPVPLAELSSLRPRLDNGDAARYLAVQERVFFELLGGIERHFGREEATRIVGALAKKYPPS
ncbi:MAG: hypothetical protein IT318_23705 [Anaerolineales bacterium]|nr:hypothetical protein [Anaerolineales bacterium]